jgi:hypothetical protein
MWADQKTDVLRRVPNGQSGQARSRKEEAKEIGDQAAKATRASVQTADSDNTAADHSGRNGKFIEQPKKKKPRLTPGRTVFKLLRATL